MGCSVSIFASAYSDPPNQRELLKSKLDHAAAPPEPESAPRPPHDSTGSSSLTVWPLCHSIEKMTELSRGICMSPCMLDPWCWIFCLLFLSRLCFGPVTA